MNRRKFLKRTTMSAAALLGSGGMGLMLPGSLAATAIGNRRLIHVMLLGGADLRFLFVPLPGTAYAVKFWEARESLYLSAATTYASYDQMFTDLYLPTSFAGGETVGIHRSAGWLAQEFEAGNVAVVANVLGSNNRRHDHSQLIAHTGDSAASQFVYDRAGWGGRFVDQIGDSQVVSVSKDVSVFCQGVDPTNRLGQVAHIANSRNFGLSEGNANPVSYQSDMGRALKQYYVSKGAEAVATKPDDWKYWRFLRHEQSIRAAALNLENQLAAVAPNQPLELQALYDSAFPDGNLYDIGFGLQCASAFDSILAGESLGLRALSMEYSGWDTHLNEKATLELQLADVFGLNQGLHTLMDQLEATMPGSRADTVMAFNSDFGRQIRANGNGGTDHGRGTYSIMMGPSVNGGYYGEMFPESEIVGTTPPFDRQGADIEGRTAFEHLYSRACDWVAPGSGVQVFPAAGQPDLLLESGVDPDSFLSGIA